MELNFREFVEQPDISEWEVVNYYLHHRDVPVREIANRTGKSIGELYRILHRYGHPNRVQNNRQAVIALADSHLSYKQIADLTGYSTRQVRNILS